MANLQTFKVFNEAFRVPLDSEKEEQDCFDACNEISILPLGYLIHCGAIM